MKVGFIGLGAMGQGMAKNIISAGFPTTLYNRTRDKAEAFVELGGKVADTPKAAAEGADVVVSCLADPPAVEAVMFGPDGAIAGIKADATLIDMSTVDPRTTLKLADALKAKGAHLLDAPVAGSKHVAAAGELVAMVGGDEQVLRRCRPVLDAMCKSVIHTGPNGTGTYTKLAFNLIVGHMGVALAEGMVLGKKAGLDCQILLDTIMSSVIGSKFYEWKGGCILNRDFSQYFATRLMHKDLNLAMSVAYDLNIALPVTAAVKELFGAAKATGHEDEDFCSVIRPLEEIAGIEVTR